MFGFYGSKRVAITFASNATLSTYVYVGNANRLAIELPDFGASLVTTTANVYALVANTAAGTFNLVRDQGVYSAGSGILTWEVPSTTGSCVVPCPWTGNFEYMKLRLSNTATGGYTAYAIIHQ